MKGIRILNLRAAIGNEIEYSHIVKKRHAVLLPFDERYEDMVASSLFLWQQRLARVKQ